MGRIARRLDRDRSAGDASGQRPVGDKFVEHSVDERGILGVEAQCLYQ